MVQFIGANFYPDHVVTTVVDRRARVLASARVGIPGLKPAGDRPGVFEVPQQEWVRSGCLALRDVYFELPVKQRRLWGVAPAGPQGWIAIDPDFDPLSPLRLTPGRSPRDDLLRWLEANPKQHPRIFTVLSPKDYFRFRISGGLATDITQAAQTGLLTEGTTHWSEEALREVGIWPEWFPPAFEPSAATGRLSEEGVELTTLPGGLWLVAGADTLATAEFAAAPLESGQLYVNLRDGEIDLRLCMPDSAPTADGDGWERLRCAQNEWAALGRSVTIPAVTISDGGTLVNLLRDAMASLGTLGRSVDALVFDSRAPLPEDLDEVAATLGLPFRRGRFAGEADPGAAFLAGLSRNFFRDEADLHRKIDAALESRRPEERPSEKTDATT